MKRWNLVSPVQYLHHFNARFSSQSALRIFFFIKMNSIVRNNTDSVEYFIIFNGSNLITGIIILIYFLLFPFYVYVNKANRKRDQAVRKKIFFSKKVTQFQVLIYPFTKHFFKMTVVMSILYVIFIAGMLSGVLFLVRKS